MSQIKNKKFKMIHLYIIFALFSITSISATFYVIHELTSYKEKFKGFCEDNEAFIVNNRNQFSCISKTYLIDNIE